MNNMSRNTVIALDAQYAETLVQEQVIDVMALAASGCDDATLSLAISDLRSRVTEFAKASRAYRKVTVR